jgi:hypothetical protein
VNDVEPRHWWGPLTVQHGRAARFRVGPLILTIARLENEWRLCRESSGDANDRSLDVEHDVEPCEPAPNAIVSRYGLANGSNTLEVTPVLPDRAVVTRPEHPFTVPAHDQVTVYVGCPLWLRVAQGEPDPKPLEDFAVFRPSQCWWGPNTREGQLCYATRTYGRLRIDETVVYPHRVTTAVDIKNDADQPLLVERVNLPVERLSIYVSKGGRLWTQKMTLERTAGQDAALNVGNKTPPEAQGVELVSGPRRAASQRMLFRAFGGLFKW